MIKELLALVQMQHTSGQTAMVVIEMHGRYRLRDVTFSKCKLTIATRPLIISIHVQTGYWVSFRQQSCRLKEGDFENIVTLATCSLSEHNV